MKKQYLLGLTAGTAFVFTFSINAAQSNNTIKSCGLLLPAGYIFDMEINATISTENGPASFEGNFSVTDGGGAISPSLSQEQIDPYINCVVSLIE